MISQRLIYSFRTVSPDEKEKEKKLESKKFTDLRSQQIIVDF